MFVCPECGYSQATFAACPTDKAALADRGDDALLGTTVGLYRIAQVIGTGGMGRVYKGVHPQIGSRVAIKVLSHECSERKDVVERFFSEARAVNLIHHENIVNVLDLASLPDGRPYIVMEYLDGSSLGEVIGRATILPLGGIARMATEVLAALAAAHDKGVIHRDLKPDNIILSPTGRAKVLDFGIAKFQPEFGAAQTRDGSILGTPEYMPPEQAQGRTLDQRADLYAMGVILYECVTGQRPFEAEAMFELLRMQVEDEPVPPRRLRADLSAGFEHVILTAMRKDPARRFASATAMANALAHATTELPAAQWDMITPTSGGSTTSMRAVQTTQPRAPLPTDAQHATQSLRPPITAPEIARETTPMRVAQPPRLTDTANATHSLRSPVVASVTTARSPNTRARWIGVGAVLTGAAALTIALSMIRGGRDAKLPVVATAAVAMVPAPATTITSTAPAQPAPVTIVVPPSTAPTTAPTIAIAKPRATAKLGSAVAPVTVPAPALAPVAVPVPAPAPAPVAAPTAAPASRSDSYPTAVNFLPSASRNFHAFNVDAEFATAVAMARRASSDAKFVNGIAKGVAPSGLADFTRAQGIGMVVQFLSPSHAVLPAGLPAGSSYEWQCRFEYAVMNPQQPVIMFMPLNGYACGDVRPAPLPRCTTKQIWAKAISAGAPAENAVADFFYGSSPQGQASWHFNIGTQFDKYFTDDC